MKHRITPDDFEKIEAEMKKIAKENQRLEYKAIRDRKSTRRNPSHLKDT